jgi:hypothetical protein
MRQITSSNREPLEWGDSHVTFLVAEVPPLVIDLPAHFREVRAEQ